MDNNLVLRHFDMQPSLCENALSNATCLCVSVHLSVCLVCPYLLSVCLSDHLYMSVHLSICQYVLLGVWDRTLFKNDKATGSPNIVSTIGLYTFLFK